MIAQRLIELSHILRDAGRGATLHDECIRGRDARSALDGICREASYKPDVTFLILCGDSAARPLIYVENGRSFTIFFQRA